MNVPLRSKEIGPIVLRKETGVLTCSGGKSCPTIKLASQLKTTPILTATDRGPWANNSGTIIHGIEPISVMKKISIVKEE